MSSCFTEQNVCPRGIRPRSRRLSPRAFSLVELLVVLAIIAVLIALLLPSLSRAREQAARTRCMNNLRTIGLGIAIYTHDYGEYPPADPKGQKTTETDGLTPVFFTSRRAGLMALSPSLGFERNGLACPAGWASGGDPSFYDSRGISSSGNAYMDYAYWPWRYPAPSHSDTFDVRFASFQYRMEKGLKILASDMIGDIGDPKTWVVGVGNHSINHTGRLSLVQRTDGKGKRIPGANRIGSTGASVLFADYHVQWFPVEKLTQTANGVCYPPRDQW